MGGLIFKSVESRAGLRLASARVEGGVHWGGLDHRRPGRGWGIWTGVGRSGEWREGDMG